MSIGLASDFKIYNDQVNGGFVEQLTQVSEVFNGASNNALQIIPKLSRGQYEYDSFFKVISNAVSRRDTTSTSAATSLAVTQDEHISVKLNRKIGPIEQTLDAFRKIGKQGATDQELSFLLGGQFAKAVQVDYLNSLLIAMTACVGVQSSLLYTVPTSGTLNTAGLVSGLSKFGDNADNIVAWVMHSKPYYDLVQSQITANIPGVSNFNVATASPVSLNRPIIVTDSAALVTDDGTSPGNTEYFTLGLVAGGGIVEQSEDITVAQQLVLGLENITVKMQAEYAFNLSLAGVKWDVQNGGANPTNSALGTGSNWDTHSTSVKSYPGVRIRSR